ncbi:DUF397 domain-containing protein [Streptomyces sp. NPDC056672]|uniref:DUF397 domain-containing protein n=1 Tax=Streptomyces sp. NPDC056672 TaxID=3345906 RepID=UPI003677564D
MSSTPDPAAPALAWVKSTYSGGEGGQCIEWAPEAAEIHTVVPVRDSKHPQGPVLVFPVGAFAAFVGAVRRGHFDAS